MFLNIFEILDIVIMTLVMGFLFMSSIKPIKKNEDILDKYLSDKPRSNFDWHGLWFAALITAPAIVLHEFGHKITALSMGFVSTFHGACSTSSLVSGAPFLDFYCGLTLVSIVLKIVGFGFIFFIPAFVQTIGTTTAFQQMIISAAGPLVNLAIFLGSWLILKYHKNITPKTAHILTLTKNINIFLFVFNILPIPGFDGFGIFSNLGRLAGFW
jgi:Zn-dependent protease